MNPGNDQQPKPENQVETTTDRMAAMRARVEASTARVHEIAQATQTNVAGETQAVPEITTDSSEREIAILKIQARTKAYRSFDDEPDIIKRSRLISERVDEINSRNVVSDDAIPNLDNNEISVSEFKRQSGLEG